MVVVRATAGHRRAVAESPAPRWPCWTRSRCRPAPAVRRPGCQSHSRRSLTAAASTTLTRTGAAGVWRPAAAGAHDGSRRGPTPRSGPPRPSLTRAPAGAGAGGPGRWRDPREGWDARSNLPVACASWGRGAGSGSFSS